MWHNPVKYGLVSRESFIELYLKSIQISKNIIVEVDKYIRGEKVVLEDIFHKIFPGKTLKELTPEEWDIAYDYILKKYNNNPSNIL